MSRSLGNTLPADLLATLRGRDLERVADQVIVVCTVDERGFPHAALLSYFEVVALGAGTLRLAMYGDSRTTANVVREKRLTLILVHAHVAYYIKGEADVIAPAMKTMDYNAKVHMRIVDVLADAANPELEPGAYIASGPTYVNPMRAQEMARARTLLAELQE
jgi:pyridoxamine 5'-phosphate oxidase-like protein